MQKQEILDQITAFASKKLISKQELIAAFESGTAKNSDTTKHSVTLSEIMYFVGGAIVFLGIAILIGQNWQQFNTFTKILTTLGSGVAAYVAGLVLMRDKKLAKLAQAFFFISALVTPLGLFVTFDQAGFDTGSAGTNVIISLMLFGMFFASYSLFRQNLFLLFSILFATWLFFALTSYLIGSNPIFERWRFYMYRIVVVSLSYIFLGYHFQQSDKEEFTGFLYGLGIFGFLGAALALGGWSPNQYYFWELLFPGLVFAVMFLSTRLKSKAFLVFGAVYLMLYILKITSEYFQEGLGWPLSLVIAGLALIGVGYYTFYLNRKYIEAGQAT
jgi:hypothetical protein